MKNGIIVSGIICGLAGVQAMAAGTNYLSNSGFETQGSAGTTAQYWEDGYPDSDGDYWGTASRRTWRAYRGSAEGTVCGSWVGGTEGGMWQQARVAPGRDLECSGWFWSDYDPGAGNIWTSTAQGMKIEFFADPPVSSNLIDAVYNEFLTQEMWIKKTIRATAPTGTVWARVVIYATGIGYNGALQFDEISLHDYEAARFDPGPCSRRTPLVFSEIMYHPSDRPDGRDLEYIELYNTEPMSWDLSGWKLDGAIEYTFADGMVLAPQSYLVVAQVPTNIQAVYAVTNVVGPYTNTLSNADGTVRLLNAHDAVLLDMEYEDSGEWPVAADGAGHALCLRNPSYGEGDARAWGISSLRGGSPGEGEPVLTNAYQAVMINEFLAHTDLPDVDFIELYNAGTQAVSLAGCILSDDADTNKYTLPGGTVIPAEGYVSFDATTLGFGLSSYGEEIYFKTPGDTRVIDALSFSGQSNGISRGRFPDGGDVFRTLTAPTPGTNNAQPLMRDVVINEIMYHPVSGDNDDEYIELYNRGSSAVDVGGWRFVDGIDFTIPESTVLAAGAYLVIAHDAQRMISNYLQLSSANTVGDYDGQLSDSGERLALAALDDPADTNGQAWVVMDEVRYRDGGAWGSWADGDGSSLELRDPHADNRLAANWADSNESGKSAWTTCVVTGMLGQGQLTSNGAIDQVDVMLLRRGECLVDDVAVIPEGSGNIVTNPSFESGSDHWYLRGNHVQSAIINSNACSGSWALHMRATGSGDSRANRVTGDLSASLASNEQAVLQCKVRWLRGDRYFLMRLIGGYLETVCAMDIPVDLGTPGQANSCLALHVGPAVHDVLHDPVLPGIHEPVRIQARADDPDGVAQVRLYYRMDPSTVYSSRVMTQDAQGRFTAEIPAPGTAALAAFYISGTDSNAADSRYPADTNRECLVRFGQNNSGNALGTYHIWVDEQGINSWSNRSTLSNEPVDTTFVSGDRVIYGAGIRYRGSPFIRRMEDWVNPATAYAPAYRVEFPDDNKFLGADEINLDWLEVGRDPTYQRERSAYRVAQQIGLPAIYQRYVSVLVNGLKRGVIYTDSQHVEKEFLASWYPGADDGDFHKINDWFEFDRDLDLWSFVYKDAALARYQVDGETRTARYRWCWERKKVGTYDNAYTNLMMLMEAMNETNSCYAEGIISMADAEQWMRTFAFRHAVGDWDSYGYNRGKNMFTYRPDNGKWQMLLWDMDFGLGADGGHPYDRNLFEVDGNMPAVRDMINSPPFLRMYWQGLLEVADGPFRSSVFDPAADEVYNGLHDNGANVAAPADMKAWVQNRRSYMISQLASVTGTALQIIESSLNSSSNRITFHGSAPVQAYTLTVNGRPFPVEWSSADSWSGQYAVEPGVTSLVLQALDRAGAVMAGLGSDTLSVTCSGSDPNPADCLVINEIMYHAAQVSADYIEIYNASADTAFDLYNYGLDGVDLVFTQTVIIAPGEYLVVAENESQFALAYGYDIPVAAVWNGALDNGGETLKLVQLDGAGTPTAVVDRVTYDDDLPWPLAADGDGPSLQLIDPLEDNDRVGNWTTGVTCTPGAVNSVRDDLSPFPDTWINEVQPVNGSVIQDNAGDYDPWLELYNAAGTVFSCSNYYLTDDYTNLLKWAFPHDLAMTGAAFQLIWMDDETGETAGSEYHAGCRLYGAGGGVALVHNDTGRTVIVDYMDYGAVSEDRSYGSYPDGSTNRTFFYYATPGGTNNAAAPIPEIYLNEWMADNDNGIVDPATGDCEDWFELYNAEDDPVDITGYSLTDDLADPTQWVISDSVILEAGEHRLVWADGEPGANQWGTNVLHADFKLGKSGEAIGLFDVSGRTVDSLTFGAQSSDISQGYFPDGNTANVITFSLATPGSQNLMNSNRYTITASAGEHGSISPSGNVEVAFGYAQEFEILADTFYEISEIRSNGIPVYAGGATGRVYTWHAIKANGMLAADFAAQVAAHDTPLWWLAENGLTNASWNTEALGDQDGDGISSWGEYIAGTMPTSALSVLEVDGAMIQDGVQYVIQWPSVTGRVYDLEFATNLSGAFAPMAHATNLAATPAQNRFTNTLATNRPAFYYRIQVRKDD